MSIRRDGRLGRLGSESARTNRYGYHRECNYQPFHTLDVCLCFSIFHNINKIQKHFGSHQGSDFSEYAGTEQGYTGPDAVLYTGFGIED